MTKCTHEHDLHHHLHCGWGEARLEVPATPIISGVTRRQVLVGLSGLSAAAVVTACSGGSTPTASGTPGASGSAGPAASAAPLAPAQLGDVMNGLQDNLVWQTEFYKDLHMHPDVWPEEARTAAKVTAKLQEIGVDEILQIGGGVVGIIRNGEGRTVLFRADMDALPVTEATNLEYKSVEEGKMHACGHDFHVAAGLGAAALLAANRSAWKGTYLALFQPGEETGTGAKAMVDDGLVAKLQKDRPEVCLAQHVLTTPESGHVATRAGAVLSAGDSIRITVFGKGGHGSMPHLAVDPAVLASAIVMRFQSIVSRELAPGTFGVVTVGQIKVGVAPNVISDRAVIDVNVRAYDNDTRKTILAAIDRIVRAECQASGSPQDPTFETLASFPLTVNDAETTKTITAALTNALGADRVHTLAPVPASEDFSLIPDAFGVPYNFWGFGGFLPGMKVVGNHNPEFAPALEPTLQTGTEAAVAGAMAYLGTA